MVTLTRKTIREFVMRPSVWCALRAAYLCTDVPLKTRKYGALSKRVMCVHMIVCDTVCAFAVSKKPTTTPDQKNHFFHYLNRGSVEIAVIAAQ